MKIWYSKIRAKSNRRIKNDLENKLKDDLNTYDQLQKYNEIKSELEETYEKFVEGAKVRSKCTWYEKGEKPTKLFLNLEKKGAIQEQIWKLIIGNQEILDQNKIHNELQLFYINLFKSNCTKSYDDWKKFLDKIKTPELTREKANFCEGDLVESELLKSLSSTQDCKSPGNDGLTKEFYEYFWNVTRDALMNSIKEARKKEKLNISQRQAVIKLIEKKGQRQTLHK